MYLYLHVPFCASKCIYCDFTVVLAKHGGQERYQQAVLLELEESLQGLSYQQRQFEGIYIGGGTPSLLPAAFYGEVFELIRRYGNIADHAEITLEANPNAVVDLPRAYQHVGFNRVSIGVQSLQNDELKVLSRAHTAQDAMACVESFYSAGFNNISIDLMHGFPRQTLEGWQHTLQTALSLPIQHLSFYGLQVEEATPMARLVHTPAYSPLSETLQNVLYDTAIQSLQQTGWQHYEISNASVAGYESRHNLNYWQPWNHNQGQYLAVGPGAHGYIQKGQEFVRTENTSNVGEWLNDPMGTPTTTLEPTHQRLENSLVFGLRTLQGVPVEALNQQFGAAAVEGLIEPALRKFPEALQLNNGVLTLNPTFWPVSNAILESFI